MSKKQIKIKENIMEQIKENKISMRPKSYFVFGTILTFVGLITSVITSIFLISVINFILKEHGPMGDLKLSLIINSFPLWLPILAIITLFFGVWNLSKYDFSYKKNYLLIIIIFITAIIISGWALDKTGIDNLWLNQGPMKGMMRNYIQKGGSQSGSDNYINTTPGRGYGRNNN